MVSQVRGLVSDQGGAGPGVSAQPGHVHLQLDSSSEDNLDLPHRDLADSSADLSCDSRVNSDYETDGEGYTDGEGGPYTDVDEEPPAPALARSSEPVLADEPQILQDHGRPSGHQAPQVSKALGWLWQGSLDWAKTCRELIFCQGIKEEKLP